MGSSERDTNANQFPRFATRGSVLAGQKKKVAETATF
jgi:hypothetical protein